MFEVFEYSNEDPIVSIITPVFNREHDFSRWLNSLISVTVLKSELILIVDFCDDNTHKVVDTCIRQLANPGKITSIKVHFSQIPLFETRCDNMGFQESKAEYVIEMQADLQVETYGYDRMLVAILASDPSVFSVSGRCGHSLKELSSNLSILDKLRCRRQRVGLTGGRILRGESVKDDRNFYFLCETVNRGPVAYRSKELFELNYLDESAFFLGNDDHDINLRAFKKFGQVCAYRPVKIFSPLPLGSTRIERSEINKAYFSKYTSISDSSNSELNDFLLNPYFYQKTLKKYIELEYQEGSL